jgi:hypothetical protein
MMMMNRSKSYWCLTPHQGRRTSRPIGTLAPRTGAREVGQVSPETRSEVWLPPPPPPRSGVVTTEPPPPSSNASNTTPPWKDHDTATESPPLQSPIRGRIPCRFTHLAKPSRLGHRPGLGIFLTDLERHGGRGWSRWWSGVEGSGTGASCRQGGSRQRRHGFKKMANGGEVKNSCGACKRKGKGELGLNPSRLIPLYP